MEPVIVGLAAFVVIFSGAVFGMWLANRLPRHHLDPDSRNTVAVSMSVVSTLSALALGLLITQSSSTFAARTDAVHALAASVMRLDRCLRDFGPAASNAELTLHNYAAAKLNELSTPTSVQRTNASLDGLDRLTDAVVQLPFGDAEHRFLRQQAAGILQNITDDRWRLAADSDPSMPTAFLGLVVFWLTLLFVSFGVFSPRNVTVRIALLSSAIAVSAGIYMIVELGTPNTGFILTPVRSLQSAVAAIAI